MPSPSGVPAGGTKNDPRPIVRPCRIIVARGVARDVRHVSAERIDDIDIQVGTGCGWLEPREHDRGSASGPRGLTAGNQKKKERHDVLDHDHLPGARFYRDLEDAQ